MGSQETLHVSKYRNKPTNYKDPYNTYKHIVIHKHSTVWDMNSLASDVNSVKVDWCCTNHCQKSKVICTRTLPETDWNFRISHTVGFQFPLPNLNGTAVSKWRSLAPKPYFLFSFLPWLKLAIVYQSMESLNIPNNQEFYYANKSFKML